MRNYNVYVQVYLKWQLRILFSILSTAIYFSAAAQDTPVIKVFFLYGSKPAAKYKKQEPKWFGGMLGGHVGIEKDSNRVFSFTPYGRFHWFAKKKHLHSRYIVNTEADFWNTFGGNKTDSVKQAVVVIPVTKAQLALFDSLQNAYLQQTPYDYAFLGMRCSAAAYDVLALLGILDKYSHNKTYLTIFYPAKLRHRLFAKVQKNGWVIIRQPGTVRRKWERG